MCFIHKGLNKNGFVFKNGKRDTLQWGSIKVEISSKVEEKETAPTGPQNVRRREGGKINKEKTIKVNLMHKHFIHARSYII